MTERKTLIDTTAKVSVRRQCQLLAVPRSSAYYSPAGEGPENLELMDRMDRLFTDDPTLGVLGMRDELAELGVQANTKRIRRLLRLMGVEPIYPKANLSKRGKAQYVRPYLLRGVKIVRPNQVWAIDITYIPMRKGWLYLTAIIDLYSRYIVGWSVSNSLAKQTQTDTLACAVAEHGVPEIINSDQGSQYTCAHWLDTLKQLQIQVSMDGKGRATDNAFIERWFRTLKQRHIYLNPADDARQLCAGVSRFVHKYNRRRHQGIERRKPIDLYRHAA